MSIHVALNHVTHYRYDRLVSLSPQVIRLRPAAHSRTPILAYSLNVTPAEHFINWQQDPHGNYLARLNFPNKTRELRVEVDLVAQMSVINPFDFFTEPYATQFPFNYEAELRDELLPYLRCTTPDARLKGFLATIPRQTMGSVDFLVDINQRVQRAVGYVIRLEPGVQTPQQTLELGRGSCRDSAWLLVEVLRQLGLAARFVSGYLIQLVADVKPLDGPAGVDADFTDLHAWCEVYLPGAGWIGLDPTSGLFAGEGHIPLACSPQPSSASPITGYSEKCECVFEHHMRVERVREAPRVTKPYSEAQWSAIEALGRRIDDDLERGDVRLTMGGEPTFVAIDDPDGAEWNSEALGPTKRLLAADVFHRLREKYAPHGLTHFGQGKWYPGEQLPRWSLNCYWRRDGRAIWEDAALYANEKDDYGADADLAGRFLRLLAERLGLPVDHVFPAYEDAFYYLWREHRLPINVDPLDARLDDAQERDRLARVFGQGLRQIVGYALPVMRHPTEPARWQTSLWYLRGELCRLVPGDSPIGYRLPLDAQPWVAKNDYPYTHAPDPTQNFAPLPDYTAIGKHSASNDNAMPAPAAGGQRPPSTGQSASGVTRTAIALQAREGRLYVFMPPTDSLDDYLELVAAIEATARDLAMPVLIEGYEPPSDPRLTGFRVTPDPGVIEVNVEPCASWNELVEHTTHLYDAAHQSRLSTEKFMLDGRHTGTGGGNHFVFGARTALDSPFLRRPDLLRSMISYWHNHPALSYLFSGLFIGPTSQAPRIDEARNDSVYELELAFSQFPEPGKDVPPWLVDRLLRNLLIDASGNTHRTEFCIDKLYSPDSASGRLGLLEMRAFEMPPHARMSLAQQLLLRALIARFWHTPYAPHRLVRWGTELHDRFMLPHFIRQDFSDVIDELRAAGYPVEIDWFAPHFEFRFPVHGYFVAREIRCELRQALEPWHVMGEQGTAGGTVRYVDASCERLEVKVSGMSGDRYVLTCNGVPVPLRSTGTRGEYVAGVRYRAWRLPSALHPTIGIDAPLTFDLVDTWTQRSLGGCRYHVEHPGGRNPERHPVNAYEAEGRRLARFSAFGHTPGRICVVVAAANESFPFTLDLRRF